MKADLIRPMSGAYAEYLRDESRSVGSADSIAFPQTEQELAEALAHAYAKGEYITLQGARTGLAAAAVPGGGQVVNLMRMNGVLGMREDAEGRYYLRVQPGMVLSQLRKLLEEKRFDTTGWSKESIEAYTDFMDAPDQFFTPDPTETTASIGGMAACNASGAMSYRYGPVRRHVSGVRVLLCSGETLTLQRGDVQAQGRSLRLRTDQGSVLDVPLPTFDMPKTKNASGYYIADDMDAVDLFVGSDGTLGVMTEIELALAPKPRKIWGVSCFFEKDGQVVPFVQRVRARLQAVASVEYFDANALAILRGQKKNNPAFSQLPEVPRHFSHCIYLELHCAGTKQALRELFMVGGIMDEVGAGEANSWVARTEVDRDKLLFFRHAIPESVNMMIDRRKSEDASITKLGTDMAVPDDCLAEMMDTYRDMLAEEGLEYAIWGHIGDNHLHVNILPRNAQEMVQGKELYGKWAAMVSKMGGSVSAEHGVGKLKAPYLVVMYGEKHIREMERLKRVFDPKGLLGVGNMFVMGARGEEA